MKYEHPDLVKYRDTPNKYYTKDYQELHYIFSKADTKSKIEAFETTGFKMVFTDDGSFIVRFESQTIVDLKRSGFSSMQFSDIEQHYRYRKQSANDAKQSAASGQKSNSSGRKTTFGHRNEGSHYANRERGKSERGKSARKTVTGMTRITTAECLTDQIQDVFFLQYNIT